MDKHITLSVCDYDRVKLCDLYDSMTNAPGQAHDLVYVKEISGWKTFSFSIPLKVNGERNFRWDYLQNERQIRYTEDDTTEWFLLNIPKRKHDVKVIELTTTCDHISAVLKTKNLYMVFDDENGIGDIEYLANQILAGTGWKLGSCDTFYEADGKTIKKRSLISDGKLGAYQLIQNLCELFGAYPEFDGDKKEVHLYSLNRRNAQLELTIGKNLTSLEQTLDSSSIITRLYVEGEYTEDGYVGIDDVNPTGLSFLLNFDYYKEIGMFKDTHQAALDEYVHDVAASKEAVMNVMNEKNDVDNKLNTLWGQLDFVLYVLEGGIVSRTVYGGNAAAAEKDEVFAVGDVVAVLHADGTYTLTTLGEDAAVSFNDTDLYLIKYITRAAGEIGAKEVAIEAKDKVIANLEKDLQKDYITEAKRESILQQIADTEAAIILVYTGTDGEPGLYAKVFEAAELAVESDDLRIEYNEAVLEQELVETRFVVAMGDMLKDGYWNNSNYIVGQEENLYKDALEIMKDLAKPSVAYLVSVFLQQKVAGWIVEKFDLNTSIRLYDEEMRVNDFLYVSKFTHYPDTPYKDTVEISNEYINIQRKTFESVLSRITQLADILDVRKSLYDRADAIGKDGSIPALRLEGTIDMMKAQLSSAVSNWYTDENGNIIFLSVDGQSAMQLCGEGFMIADGKLEDGSWNWRSFGTGKGFTADAIVTGYLSADRIEAGSITAAKLDGSVAATIDLSDNESIKLIVKEVGVPRGDTAPADPQIDDLWMDTSGETDVLKRWTESGWVESTISQADINAINAKLSAANSEIVQMADKIESKVSTEDFENSLKSTVEQTANSITLQYQESIKNATDPQNVFRETVESYQRFTADGLELGRSDSPFIARLGNEKLSFLQDNAEVAYISNNSMYITQARVTEKLSIGTEENGYFDWITTAGGLALKWRGKS